MEPLPNLVPAVIGAVIALADAVATIPRTAYRGELAACKKFADDTSQTYRV